MLDEQGKAVTMFMGCYGIGITRDRCRGDRAKSRRQRHHLARAAGAVQRDSRADQLPEVRRRAGATDKLYEELREAGVEVLLDDRDARPGVKFADAELIGIPHRIVIGDRALAAGKLEYRQRRETESTEIARRECRSLYQG